MNLGDKDIMTIQTPVGQTSDVAVVQNTRDPIQISQKKPVIVKPEAPKPVYREQKKRV